MPSIRTPAIPPPARPHTRVARHGLALALACLIVPASLASEPATPPAWDRLTPEQRELLIAPIRERWNNEPERRKDMLDHARRWQELTPEQRRKARHGRHRWEHMNPEQRAQMRVLYHTMCGMTPEQRAALKAEWRAMTPAQRRAWAERQGGED